MANLTKWFENNYEKLGFDDIVKKRKGSFPDFTCIREGKKVEVELEMKSSNFIHHGHDQEKVDFIVCLHNDSDIDAKILEVNPGENIEKETDRETSSILSNGRAPLTLTRGRKITLPKKACDGLGVEEGDYVVLEIKDERAEIVPLNKYEVE